eukprot:c4693_g1_i1.p1 GENE.c4693_g1_i1~~c4693_g1_i1.p1  ORF type:complete len:250 (+),score=36.44 c4693_g1_i1:54-752(+)
MQSAIDPDKDDFTFHDISPKGVGFCSDAHVGHGEDFLSVQDAVNSNQSRSLNFEPCPNFVDTQAPFSSHGTSFYWLNFHSSTSLLNIPLKCTSRKNGDELVFTCAGAGTVAAKFKFNRLEPLSITLMGQAAPGRAVECMRIDPKVLGIEFRSLESMVDSFINTDGIETGNSRHNSFDDIACEEGEAAVTARSNDCTILTPLIVTLDTFSTSVFLDASPICLLFPRAFLHSLY